MIKDVEIERKSLWINLFIMIGIFIATFIFMLQSPLYLNGNSSTDSSVFQTIAMQMENELMPYKDSFDHKGPLIYLYNYWGNMIKPGRGIWIIEFLSVLTAFSFMYKIARLKCGKQQAFLILMICATPLYTYFEQGNLSEEYALPFIALAIYIFADYFINKKISRVRLIICGAGFGAVCMLRINMVAVWIVFCCAVLLYEIARKNLGEVLQCLFWFLIGAGIVIIPIYWWLIANNALMDFINDYFLFNKMYIQDTNRATLLNKYISFSNFLNNIYVLTVIGVACYLIKDKKLFHFAYLVYEVVCLVLICLSGQTYAHYGMVLVPMFVYPFAILLSNQTVRKNSWILAFILYLSVSQVIPTWISGIDKVAEFCLAENKISEQTDLVGKVCSFIKENTKADDKIIVWGNWNIIYVQSQRLPASKYSYQFPIGKINEQIMNEFFEEINGNPPKAIVNARGMGIGKMEGFLNEHDYICMYEIEGITVYMQDVGD